MVKRRMDPRIVAEVHSALRYLGAPPDLLAIVWAWGSLLNDDGVRAALKAWNQNREGDTYAQVAGDPLRTIHHFACTGGTLISRCLAACPDVFLLNEIDPLSQHHANKYPHKPFFPTDIVGEMHFGTSRPTFNEISEVFNAGIVALRDVMARKGRHVVLRDHTHSHYCSAMNYQKRPTVRSIVSTVLPVFSIVTIRHPLDSFLSLISNKWTTFSPFTIEEYCVRYLNFLTDYRDVPFIRYEDFVNDPNETLRQICQQLEITFSAIDIALISSISLSGDSGRKGSEISPRGRREIPSAVASEASESKTFKQLCDWLQYDPAL